jgi:hypothetical protein
MGAVEAVFRYLFRHNISQVRRYARAYYLSIDKKDPDSAFLKRFAGHKPPVRKGSLFRAGRGLLFFVNNVKRVNSRTYRMRAGYFEGSLSASDATYRAWNFGDGWIVRRTGPLFVSQRILHGEAEWFTGGK